MDAPIWRAFSVEPTGGCFFARVAPFFSCASQKEGGKGGAFSFFRAFGFVAGCHRLACVPLRLLLPACRPPLSLSPPQAVAVSWLIIRRGGALQRARACSLARLRARLAVCVGLGFGRVSLHIRMPYDR